MLDSICIFIIRLLIAPLVIGVILLDILATKLLGEKWTRWVEGGGMSREEIRRALKKSIQMQERMERFDRSTLRELHDKGIEMTPAQLHEHREMMLQSVRRQMIEKGHESPETYEDFIELARRLREDDQNKDTGQ